MISDDVRAVADTVLYEGYILYPYRRSSLKNQQRWTFGGLFPREYAERGGGDRWQMQCECLVRGDARTRISVVLRFLQVAARKIGKLRTPGLTLDQNDAPAMEIVESLEIDGRSYLPWDEALAREVCLESKNLGELAQRPFESGFAFPASRTAEPLAGPSGLIEGMIIRETKTVEGRVRARAERIDADIYKLSVQVQNTTTIKEEDCVRRDQASAFSLASTHTILHSEAGDFVSLTDPPDELRAVSRDCNNEGCWPVLAGEEGSTDTLLAAPIILYDYPKVAPESDCDLFDGTEIDEILILRILTMTEAEKKEMASGDPRARALLARLQSLTPDQLNRLHGTWRNALGSTPRRPRPELASLNHGLFSIGDRVRLKPRAGGDILDMALGGKFAVIEAIECDFENRFHIAVVMEDDPGRAFGLGRFPGHRFFFSPEEIEHVGGGA